LELKRNSQLGFLVLALVAGLACVSFGQEKGTPGGLPSSRDLSIRVRQASDDLDRQVAEIPFPEVRAFARYKAASWLWLERKEHTDEAERIAVSALRDLNSNKDTIAPAVFERLSVSLFNLLDANAPQASRIWREKFAFDSTAPGELDQFDDKTKWGNQAAEKAIREMSKDDVNPFDLLDLLNQLKRQQSNELPKVLASFLDAERAGRVRLAGVQFLFLTPYFLDPAIPGPIRTRYAALILNRARDAGQRNDPQADSYFFLLLSVMGEISTSAPELGNEASVALTILKSRVSREASEAQERNDRIAGSSDRLGALISEAEKTEDKGLKYDMMVSASHLALQQLKFEKAMQLAQAAAEVYNGTGSLPGPDEIRQLDQFLTAVVDRSLEAKDPDTAEKAAKKMSDHSRHADASRKTALYQAGRKDLLAARSSIDEAMKFARKAEGSAASLSTLAKLLPVAQQVDPVLVFDVVEVLAKSVNSIPTLGPDDKPRTEKYDAYLARIMAVDYSLLPVLTQLVKTNRAAVTDLGNRIDRKEVKIFCHFALVTNLQSDPPKRRKETPPAMP
jgi:hypothetical protein